MSFTCRSFKLARALTLLAIVTTLSATGATPGVCADATSDRRHFLLLDDRVIDRVENAQLEPGKVEKHARNPLMVEDKPWEKRYDNLYANVVFDRRQGIYRCWYGPFVVDHSARGMSVEERKKPYRPPRDRQSGVCYATSTDGIVWEKPALGLVDYDGSKRNNIIARGPHGVGVFQDFQDEDPSRLFKLFCKRKTISVAFSDDGIHWSDYVACPEVNARGDTHNNAFWAPTLGKYVGITREWNSEYGRLVVRTESDDFIHWSPAEVVLHGLEKNLQTYAMPTFYHGGVYLGLLAIHNQQLDRVWTELVWSPDTKQWNRVCPGAPLIGNGSEEGTYDWGCVYTAATPVFLEDHIRIYYSGSDGLHFGWRCGSLNLAMLRPDGFAGYAQKSKEKPAVVTTTPLFGANAGVAITADVLTGGYVNVTAVDLAGRPIATSSFTKTTTGGRLAWDKPIHAKEIRLRFELRDAIVYSFRLED